MVIEKLKETVKSLKKSMRDLEKKCIEMSKLENEKEIELLVSIPGISEFVAVLYLHWFDRNKGVDAKSWITYSGSDINVKESGTWKDKCKLTKRGNAYLRKRLFYCAKGAWLHNSDFKNYYDELLEKGRSHTKAIIILSRKLICIMFKVLENNQVYDSNKCFNNNN